MLLHVMHFLPKAAKHLVPHVHESVFDNLKFFPARPQQGLSLTRVLCCHTIQLFLVSFYQLFRLFEKFLSAVLVKFLAFGHHRRLDLLLEDLSVLVEAGLPEVLSPFLHFDHTGGIVQSATLYRALFDRQTEIVKFFLLLFLQLHLDQGCLVLVLGKNDVVPFVLQLLKFGLMSTFQGVHFLPLTDNFD